MSYSQFDLSRDLKRGELGQVKLDSDAVDKISFIAGVESALNDPGSVSIIRQAQSMIARLARVFVKSIHHADSAAKCQERKIELEQIEEVLPDWLDDTKPAPVSKIIIIVNIAVFLLMTLTALLANMQASDAMVDPRQGLLFFSSGTLTQWGANTAWKTIIDKEYWRILTSAFVHLNIFHLAVNMYALASFASLAERLFGRSKFIIVYVLSAVGSAICSLFFLNPESISVGASGAIFGTMGAIVAFFWMHRLRFPKIFFRTHAKIFFVVAIYSVVSSFIFQDMDNAAHLSGFVVGLWAGLCLMPSRPGSKIWHNLDFVRIVGLTAILVVELVLVSVNDERNPKVLGEHEYAEAVTLLKDGKAQQAIPYLDRALILMPTNAPAYLDRASAYNQTKQFDKALLDAARAISFDAKTKKGYFIRSLAYHHLGDEIKNIADLNRVLEIDPRAAMALNNRAWSYDEIGKVDDAITDSTRAISIDKHCSTAYDTRAVAYCLKGMYKNALEDFAKCIALPPNDGSVYYHRAFAYNKLGEKEAAASDLKKARASKYELEPWERRWLHGGALIP
jgi:membrane associated rhomboid family serine protease/Flp pilus assembly protein TadD